MYDISFEFDQAEEREKKRREKKSEKEKDVRRYEFTCPFCFGYATTFSNSKKRYCGSCSALLIEGEDFKYKGFGRGGSRCL
jgi:ribosomal protein S27E